MARARRFGRKTWGPLKRVSGRTWCCWMRIRWRTSTTSKRFAPFFGKAARSTWRASLSIRCFTRSLEARGWVLEKLPFEEQRDCRGHDEDQQEYGEFFSHRVAGLVDATRCRDHEPKGDEADRCGVGCAGVIAREQTAQERTRGDNRPTRRNSGVRIILLQWTAD